MEAGGGASKNPSPLAPQEGLILRLFEREVKGGFERERNARGPRQNTHFPFPFKHLPRRQQTDQFQPRPQGAFPWLWGRGARQGQGKAPWGRGWDQFDSSNFSLVLKADKSSLHRLEFNKKTRRTKQYPAYVRETKSEQFLKELDLIDS